MDIHALAVHINADGKLDHEDGDTILAICVEVENFLPGLRKTNLMALREYIKGTLVLLDRTYGWDMPKKEQATEEQIYGMYAYLYGTPFGRRHALQSHAEVSKRLDA